MKIMIDLETLGTKPNSAILSIGAVAFDEKKIHKSFYYNVDLVSSLKHGYEIDPDTVYWWLKQDKAAGEVLDKDKLSIVSAVRFLSDFILDIEPSEVWANSPSFDLVMLKNAWDKHEIKHPYPFYIERDFRTFLSFTGAKRVYPIIAHNALDDAKAQAQTLINYWNKA